MNRDELISYLLHQMPEAERAAIADRWMTDPDLHEQLRAAEAELLDDYVRDVLQPDQRARVEQYLLGTETQRDKLTFAIAMQDVMEGTRSARWPWASLAAAAAIVVVSAVAAWLAYDNARLRHDITMARRILPASPGSVVSASLPATIVRGTSAARTIVLAPDVEVLHLELELEPGDESGSYSATMSGRSGVLWRAEPLRATQRGGAFRVSLWIPAHGLVASDYTIVLTKDGKEIGYYAVAIERPSP